MTPYSAFMPLEVFGVAVTTVLAAAFVLLITGVVTEKQRENSLNLVKHGFLSTTATGLTLIFVFWVMIPFFSRIVGFDLTASLSQFPAMWIHAVLGTVSLGLALAMIAFWLKSPVSELGCSKTWMFMKPTLAFWAAAIVLGTFIHFHGLS